MLVTSQKRLLTSLKLSSGQKMFRFWKVTLKNLKNWETFRNLSNFKFSGDIIKLILNKNLFSKEISKKKQKRKEGKNAPLFCVK